MPDPCPSPRARDKDARNAAGLRRLLKKQQVRVVNMSWGGSVKGDEEELELCGIGKTPDERKPIAREYFDIGKDAFDEGDRQRAGDPVRHVGGQLEPGRDVRRGDPGRHRAAEHDHGGRGRQGRRRGVVHQLRPDCRRARERLSGRERDPRRRALAESGTSMSSPQVANLAAKILAVNPALTPPQVIAIILATAEKTADGRRVLINPKKAIEAARQK